MVSGEGLMSWLHQARLVPRGLLQELVRDTDRRTLDRVAARARELRDWLRPLVDQYRGRQLVGIEAADFELLNRMLVGDEKYSQIVAPDRNGSAPALQSMRRWVAPESVLGPIAEAVAQLLCEEDFTRIKACEGCSLLFVDRTRRQARKWCSMSACGNRAKQAAHRSRRRAPGR